MSLRHVSLREMGWSRKPYEFRSPPRSKSKGEATYAAFRKHAFLASKSFAAKCFALIFIGNAAVRCAEFLRTSSSQEQPVANLLAREN